MLCSENSNEFMSSSYKDYKHKTFEKYKNRVKNVLLNINGNSLVPEDRKKLKKQLIEIIQHDLK